MLHGAEAMSIKLGKRALQRIDEATEHYVVNRYRFEVAAKSLMACLTEDPELAEFIHFLKYRTKDTESLRAKLRRLHTATEDVVDASNLFERVTDLAGLRMIHLHTEQLVRIHPAILRMLGEQQYELAGEPTAYCWDLEYQELFERIGIKTEQKTVDVYYSALRHPREQED